MLYLSLYWHCLVQSIQDALLYNQHARALSAGLVDAVGHLESVVALCEVIEGAHVAVGLILKLVDECLQAADLHNILCDQPSHPALHCGLE